MDMSRDSSFSRRRALVSLGAGTLGAAMIARGLGAVAQESTPDGATTAETSLLDPSIGLIEAQEIALRDNEGAAVESVELDHERGQLVWEIELDNGAEFEIDAETGEILETDRDDVDDDDDD